MACSLGAEIDDNAILTWYVYDVKGSVQLLSRDSYLHVLQIEGKSSLYLCKRPYLFKKKMPSAPFTSPVKVKTLGGRGIPDYSHASSLRF